MRLPVLLLVLLLATATPVGTGGGAHEGFLLHSLFPHVHIVNGQPATHESPGPTVGAEAGADAADGGLGISPSPPYSDVLLPLHVTWQRLAPDARPIQPLREAPPDPPPTTTAV
jgi:hypothetical protein